MPSILSYPEASGSPVLYHRALIDPVNLLGGREAFISAICFKPETSTEIFLQIRQVSVHAMISDTVGSQREHVSGQPLELVLEIVSQRPFFVQYPVRVEVHQSPGVMVEQFRRRVRDDVIVIDEAKSAGLESCVIGLRK